MLSKPESGELTEVAATRFELLHERWQPTDERHRERDKGNRLELRETVATRVEHDDDGRDAEHRDRRERHAHMALHDKRSGTDCQWERPEIPIGRGPRQAHHRE